MKGLEKPPNEWELSEKAKKYLDSHILTLDDLRKLPDLVSSLSEECSELENSLTKLDENIYLSVEKWTSQYSHISSLFESLHLQMKSISSHKTYPDGNEKQLSVEELPKLAKEVAQVEKIRIYAETALELEALVGDLEDAVASAVVRNTRMYSDRKNPSSDLAEVFTGFQERIMTPVSTLKAIEDTLTVVLKGRSKWDRLVMAVDNRVDRAMMTLRPLAIKHYRTLLTSMGWPPPLVSGNLGTDDSVGSAKVSNLFVGHNGSIKKQFSDCLLALCILQAVHLRRKTRRFDQSNRTNKSKLGCRETLWSTEELVTQIESRAEYHFSKWTDRPEFIFALVYKLTKEYVDTIDDAFQPLIDKSGLLGYSAREEWVSATAFMISTYLADKILPNVAAYLIEEASSEARNSWLKIIDLIIVYDRKMHALAVRPGVASSLSGDSDTLTLSVSDVEPRIYIMSLFSNHPEWVELWAKVELNNVLEKLKVEFETANLWKIDVKTELFTGLTSKLKRKDAHNSFLFSTREDYKSPKVAEIVIMTTWTVINRCFTLPDTLLRFKFIKAAGCPILAKYLDTLLQHCHEAEAMTALADDDAMVKVAISINAARYCESTLTEWSKDMFFLDLQFSCDGDKAKIGTESDLEEQSEHVPALQGFVFYPQIEDLKKFQTDWLAKLKSVILRGFDARCQEYIRNKRQWQEDEVLKGNQLAEDIVGLTEINNGTEYEISVSPLFVDALDTLQRQLKILKDSLNAMDFLNLWRSIAADLDQFLFTNIVLSKAKFSDHGVSQFKADVHALFQVFKVFCLRPASFFPNLSDSLKLLGLPYSDLIHLRETVSVSSTTVDNSGDDTLLKCLRQHGLQKMLPSDAHKILKQRILVEIT